MAKDDYFVIVYEVLKYLYTRLKQGKRPDVGQLTATFYLIPESYWGYIIASLVDEGYITGISLVQTVEGRQIDDMSGVAITPKGIQYLFDNRLFEKAKKTLKDIGNQGMMF